MARIDFDLDMVTRDGLKSLVKQLLNAQDGEEKKILNRLNSKANKHEAGESASYEEDESDSEESDDVKKMMKESNDLADLDEEMHGKHNAPKVTDDDMPRKGLADIPKRKNRNG